MVTVKPKDINAVQSKTFEFYENGVANLNVILTNRTTISYISKAETLK